MARNCKHLHYECLIIDGMARTHPVRWCARCGSLFAQAPLSNGGWSKRPRWIKPRRDAPMNDGRQMYPYGRRVYP